MESKDSSELVALSAESVNNHPKSDRPKSVPTFPSSPLPYRENSGGKDLKMDHPFTGPDCNDDNGGQKNATLDSDNSSGRDLAIKSLSASSRSSDTIHALSGLYAQIVIVVTSIFVFTEVLHGPIPLLFFHGYLFTYLVGLGIVCLLGVYVSMMADKCPKLANRSYEESESSISPFKTLFGSDISIYLRIGALVFGLGTLISSGLEVASMFTMQHECMDELNLAQPVLRGLFSFLQMHFLFMDAKEIVRSLGCFRHVALMHLVATNLAIWIRLVLWESAKEWLEAVHHKHNSSIEWHTIRFNYSLHTLESDKNSLDPKHRIPTHKVYFTPNCYWTPVEEKTEDLIALHLCLKNSTIGAIWEKAIPYLYPFIIQYCLVAAAIIYIIWSNLKTQKFKQRRFTAVSVYGEDKRHKMDCAGSTKGLFLGLLILVAGMIVLILFFVLANDKEFKGDTLFVVMALRCGILGISSLAAVLGMVQIRKMKSKTRRQGRLNELLQRTGMLAVYVYGICSMIVGGVSMANTQHLVLFLDGKLMVIQACLQSLFIHQVAKKRLGPSNEAEKPGRQVVIFLVFANVVLWLLESFTTQNQVSSQLQLKFYGGVTWSLISRIVLPLVIFYRFHSAVALMEAWRKSYKIKQN